MENNTSMMVPIWAIIIIVIVALFIISVIMFCYLRRRRTRSIDTLSNKEMQKTESIESFQTVVNQPKQRSMKEPCITTTPLPEPPKQQEEIPPRNYNQKTDGDASDFNESNVTNTTPEVSPQEIRISLPMPPPSASFFTDKIELDQQGQVIYDKYSNDFTSIHLDSSAPIKPNHSQQEEIQNTSTITMDSNKTMIDMKTFEKHNLHQLNTNTFSDSIIIDDESPITPNTHLQEPIRAAKRVIRSASRKTKTRSMVINDDHQGTIKEDKKIKHGSIRFTSMRGPRQSGEHMTITSGSMRRLVRESILFDDQPSMPSSSADIVSTKSHMISAVDIAGWWDKNQTTTTEDNSLFKNVSAGSNSSNTPNQYRASLSTSIFGTLSKSNPIAQEINKEDDLSRRLSFRRGTLSRNTLRNLTAGANNVNRSIKGLFDHHSNNTVVPDDSQKMELDSEPIHFAVEEKTVMDQQNQIQQQQQYNSVRQKSLRNSLGRNVRPSLPSTYLPTSESSTKYALSDEECFQDDQSSSKETITTIKIEETNTTTTKNGEVDTIRRMLQDTWRNHMKESGSMVSILSEVDSIATNSTSSKLLNNNTRQSLLTKSLLTQHHSLKKEEMAPQPSPSFSSSTVRTVVPESNQDSHKESETNRNHSRKSSGGNSAATALRISSGGSINNTWNGKRMSRPSVSQEPTSHFFSTMRKGQKGRKNIPWLEEEQDRTPAQIERDRYLEGN